MHRFQSLFMLNSIVTSKMPVPALFGHASIFKPTRTCCTAAVAHWWTTRTPTKLWTKPGLRTVMSCKPRPISSSAARSLRKSLTRPSKVGGSWSLPNRRFFLIWLFGPCSLSCPVLSTELVDFKTRRVAAFRKNLVELAELELKHAKVPIWHILLSYLSVMSWWQLQLLKNWLNYIFNVFYMVCQHTIQ